MGGVRLFPTRGDGGGSWGITSTERRAVIDATLSAGAEGCVHY